MIARRALAGLAGGLLAAPAVRAQGTWPALLPTIFLMAGGALFTYPIFPRIRGANYHPRPRARSQAVPSGAVPEGYGFSSTCSLTGDSFPAMSKPTAQKRGNSSASMKNDCRR